MTRANQFEKGLKTRTHSSHKIADSSHHNLKFHGLVPELIYIDQNIQVFQKFSGDTSQRLVTRI
jgi:hypothetical protein